MQIFFDQRLNDGHAEMFSRRFLLGLVHADAVVTDSNDARFAFTANRNGNHAVRPAFKAVDDGIGNEFIEDQGQGRDDIGRQEQFIAGKLRLHAAFLTDQAVGQEVKQLLSDVGQIDIFVVVIGQGLMDQGNAQNPIQALLQDVPCFVAGRPPHLHPQQAGNGLQIVFDPVVDFLDDRRLDHQFRFFAMEFGPFRQDGNDAPHLAALQNGNDPPRYDGVTDGDIVSQAVGLGQNLFAAGHIKAGVVNIGAGNDPMLAAHVEDTVGHVVGINDDAVAVDQDDAVLNPHANSPAEWNHK